MLRAVLQAIPNLVSLSRLALAAAFSVVEAPHTRAAIVLGAALTDVLDGWIARLTRTQSRSGALIDPIADRAFMAVAFFTVLIDGMISGGECFLLLMRDIATVIGYFVAKVNPSLKKVTFKARVSGKLTTGLQLVALVAILLKPAWIPGIAVATGVVSLWAIADYTRALARARRRLLEQERAGGGAA